MNRKDFIQKSSITMALFHVPDAIINTTNAKRTKYGIQLFSMPKMCSEDFAQAIGMISKMGFKQVEFYGPYTFSTQKAKEILDNTDPNLVFMEMNLFWTTAGGINPVDLLTKHKGRYKMLHIKDMKEQKRFAGDGGSASEWIPLFPFMTSAGDGVIDLKNIIHAARKTGVEYYFVEQDMVTDPRYVLKKAWII